MGFLFILASILCEVVVISCRAVAFVIMLPPILLRSIVMDVFRMIINIFYRTYGVAYIFLRSHDKELNVEKILNKGFIYEAEL